MQILFALEIIGTIAFAISGAVVGIQKKMDIFGVCILGLTASVGGGILRDLILNITPPAAFRNAAFAVTAILVSILFFIPAVRNAFEHRKVYEALILIMDSIGLGLFTVVGVQVATAAMPERNLFLITFVGVLTGVGGGILRDVLDFLKLPTNVCLNVSFDDSQQEGRSTAGSASSASRSRRMASAAASSGQTTTSGASI